MIRPDLIFSYWVFVWWIAYLLKWTTFSPKLAILIGMIENALTLIAMVYLKIPQKYIGFFAVMFAMLKGIPYYTVKNDTIRNVDIWFTFLLFTIYLIWCELNQFAFYKVATTLFEKKYDLPGMTLLDYLQKRL